MGGESFIINSSNSAVCYDNSTKMVNSGSDCSGKTLLWNSTIATGDKLNLTEGLSGTIQGKAEKLKMVEGGILADSQPATAGVNWTSGTPPTCGKISNGDLYEEMFECRSETVQTVFTMSNSSGNAITMDSNFSF